MGPVTTDHIKGLRVVLRSNASTSGLGGLTALVAAERVDRWLGSGHPGWVRLVGAGLVAFACAIVALSRLREETVRRWTPAVSVADMGWVAASAVTIFAGWYSDGGAIIIAIVAAAVATFAVL